MLSFLYFLSRVSSGEGFLFFFVLDLADYAYYFVGLTYQGKDIVLRFIIEYSSLKDFYRPLVGYNNSSILLCGCLKE